MLFNELDIEVIDNGTDVGKFKNLILKRDQFRKEETKAYLEYVRTFGELIEQKFSLQIECIKNKKIIAICQAKKNRGEEEIYIPLIEQDIDKELEEYYQELQTIREISQEEGEAISEYEYLLIKRKYKRIAMRIHPDLHSDYAGDTELMDIWEKVKVAYKCNNLVALEEAEILVADYLKNHGEKLEVDIQNVDKKIEKLEREIEMITSNDPYRYKFILEDENAIDRKKEELEMEIEEYQEYLTELVDKLNEFNISKELLN